MANNTIEIRITAKNETGNILGDLNKSFSKLGDVGESGLGKITSAFADIAKYAIGGVITSGINKIASGLYDAASSGFEFNNSIEQTTARINAFTKDAGETKLIIEGIKTEASKTPFAFQEMANSFAALLPTSKMSGAAMDELIAKAEVLAASNPAQGLEGAAFALKEAVSGDFTSIIERFNLPRSYINQLKEQGLPALEIVGKAMGQLGLDMSLVSGMAETASGRWSTFQDTLVNLYGTVTQPMFDVFSGALGTINGWLAQNEPLLTGFANTIASLLKPIVDDFANTSLTFLLGKLTEWLNWLNGGGIQGIIDWGKSIMDILGPAIDWLRFIALPSVLTIASTVWGWIAGTAIPFIREWANTIYYDYLRPAFDWLYNIGLPLLLSTGQSVWEWITGQAIPTIQEWANAIYVQYLKPAWDWLTKEALPVLLEKGQLVWDWITGTAIPKVKEWANTIYDYLKPKWDTLVMLFDQFSKKIAPKLQEAWDALDTAWTTKILPSLVKMQDSFAKILDVLGIAKDGGVKGQISGVNNVLDAMVLVVEKITPMIETLADCFTQNAEALEKVANWLDDVDRQFQLITGGSLAKFIDDVVRLGWQLNSLILPSFLTPGSPTPFELGLRGISSAIKDMPKLDLMGGGGSGGNTSNVTNNKAVNLTINTPAVMPLQSELQFLDAMAG